MAGRFKKVSRIGRGTFGEAWLVTSVCSGRRYVIKEVRVDEMSEEELEKTRTEATILARCKHNSIIRYKEYFMLTDPAIMCLVMEYADGGDLAEKVRAAKKKGETLTENTILHWFIQVIFAVQYLHANNILHRDLKTQNIFLTKTNLVKVGDFGIARFLRDKQDLATTAIGTPYYLSPEICQRRPYNHKSDMWAVGCILYELSALRHPFDAENFEDLVVKILRGAFRPLPVSFSNLIKNLISVMLRTNPERRPTADALLMLPALKPYVENYLLQYEELLCNNVKCSSSSDDKATINRSPICNDISVPSPVELDDKIKVCELDKQRSILESNNPKGDVKTLHLMKEDFNTPPSQDLVPVVPSAKAHSTSNLIAYVDSPCTPPKDLCYKQRDLHSVSSLGDTHISSPKFSAEFNTPFCKLSCISSPVHPPAPPNTPVDAKFSNTPPSIPVMNISVLYSTNSSLSGKKSPNKASFWRTPDHAPTPCNTPTELNISFDTPPVTDNLTDKHLKSMSPCFNPVKISSSNTSISTPASNSPPVSIRTRDSMITNCKIQILDSPPLMESRYSKIYSRKRCLSCGRGFNETYIIDKKVASDTSADSVFEL